MYDLVLFLVIWKNISLVMQPLQMLTHFITQYQKIILLKSLLISSEKSLQALGSYWVHAVVTHFLNSNFLLLAWILSPVLSIVSIDMIHFVHFWENVCQII